MKEGTRTILIDRYEGGGSKKAKEEEPDETKNSPVPKEVIFQWVLYVLLVLIAIIGQTSLMIGFITPSLMYYIFLDNNLEWSIWEIEGLFFATGLILNLTAFFGGVWFNKSNATLCILHIVALVFTIVVTFILGVAVVIITLPKTGHRYIDQAWIDLEDGDDVAINRIEQYFECCGKNGPEDYPLYPNMYNEPSCFLHHESGQWDLMFQEGCYDKIRKYLNFIQTCFIIVILAAEIIEVVGIVICIILYRNRYPNDVITE